MRIFFFGCWNEPGHFLRSPYRCEHDPLIESFKLGTIHIDGTLAPRVYRAGSRVGVGVCWTAQGDTREDRSRIQHASDEMPQGRYLHHVLDNGFSAVTWWDRCQGDTRGACNSVILLRGEHDAETVLVAGRESFPSVFENLRKAGVDLAAATSTPPIRTTDM